MTITLKQELTTWSDALDAYEAQDYEASLAYFETIADSSKILFNIALILATIGQHEEAIQSFSRAINADSYFAVAYYQSGVSNFLLERYDQARQDFDDAYTYLRSNATIDYEQLGLKFKLYSCEVLFNRGLSLIYLGDERSGMADFSLAMKEKQTDEHNVIDEAFADRGHAWRVFSIPVGVLYRPSENKLKNLKTKNYLGSAKLVAATDSRDAFIGFSGTTKLDHKKNEKLIVLDSKASDEKGTRAGLSRSKTSTARLEKSEFGAPIPLRRRATGDIPKIPPFTPSPKSLSKPDLNRSLSSRQFSTSKGNVSLPTPPASDGLRSLSPLPRLPFQQNSSFNQIQDQSSNSRKRFDSNDNPYDGMNVIDDYYDDQPGFNTPRAGSLPRLPRSDSIRPTPEGQPIERVATWARETVSRGDPESLSRSNTGGSNSTRGGYLDAMLVNNNGNDRGGRDLSSNRGGMGMIRQLSGMNRSMSNAGRSESRYQSENGYEVTIGSGIEREMSKVRVKLRYRNDTRGMSITPEMALKDFVEKVRVKFGSSTDLPMKYRDSQGTDVSIVDDDDWESAMDEAREAANGRSEGKLEIIIT